MSTIVSPAPSLRKSNSILGRSAQHMWLVSAAIVVAGLYFGRPVLLPVAIAALLAFAVAPLVGLLRRFNVGRVSSVFLASTLVISVVGGVGAFVGTEVTQLTDELPLYERNLIQKIQSIRGMAIQDGRIARASDMVRNLRDQLAGSKPRTTPSTNPLAGPSPVRAPVPVEIQQPEISPSDVVINVAGPILEPVAAAIIVIIFTVFILLQKEDIRDRLVRLAGSHDIQRTTMLLDEGAERLSQYLVAQTAVNATFGAAIAGGLSLIGLPNAPLWGLLVMIFRFVPYVGVPIAAFLPCALALAVDPGWSLLFWTVALFFGGELILGQVVEPWLYGRKMGLSPVAVVVSATFWTWIWGPLGLLLSTPMTMGLVVLGRHIEPLHFLNVLLGDRPPLGAEETLYLRMLSDDVEEAAGEAETFLKENSLCAYYNEVALKALAMAQADVNRGVLDHDRVLKIKDTTKALLQILSDSENDAAKPTTITELQDSIIALHPPRNEPVVCIAGRGPLDEAAALLLAQLLEKQGIPVQLFSSKELTSNGPEMDLAKVRIVCICFLDPGNFVRARHILKRVRMRMPLSFPLAAFWAFSDTNSGNGNAVSPVPCEVVTSLNQSLERILSERRGHLRTA